MSQIKKALTWVHERWTKGTAFVKLNKRKTVAGCALFSLFITGTALANHYYNSNSPTLYHVYVDGAEIGIIDNPDLIQRSIDLEVAKQKEEQGFTHAEVSNKIEWKEDNQSLTRAANEKTIQALQQKIKLKVTAQAVVVDGEVVAYAADQDTIQDIMDELKQKYGPLPVAHSKSATVKIASQQEATTPVEVKIKEKVEIKSSQALLDQVLSGEELKNLLEKGTPEEVVHTVKPGDCISCIASQYEITTKDIYQANPGINEDTVLQLGQELVVSALKPKITVQTMEKVTEEQIIDYQIEVKPTQTMYRGETKTVQDGKEGKKKVTYEIVKENGVQTAKNTVEEEILAEPVKKIVHKGIKVKPDRGSGAFIWPTYGGSITSGYGKRWGKMHEGLDIAGVSNRNIKSSDNGRVVSAGWNGNYGNCVIIDHGNGYRTLYGHLSSIAVSVGDVVEQGEKIGVMGSTGDSTGTHLHFEILKNGANANPMQFFRG